ncbi:MAG TPA: GIDE domain-containing protein [Myxococcota bacterium]|jgi:hypothetical protein|nr:GIDE domain-containing protein [Myxococcota bacterium]
MDPGIRTITEHRLLLLAGAAIGLGLFLHGFTLWRRRRRIEDTPTSKVRSLSLGCVELSGRARARTLLRGPLSSVPCVFFRWRVEEERRSGKSRSWHTVASGSSEAVAFELEDDTGRVLVDPRGAQLEIEAQLRETDPEVTPALREIVGGSGLSFGGWLLGSPRVRVTEERIHEGDPLYVLGLAQPRPGASEEQRQAIAADLRTWKADPAAMARLDRDGDGHVDADEWELARSEVARRHAAEPAVDPVIVGRDPTGDATFLLSALGERALVRRLGWRSLASVVGGAGLALLSLAFLVSGCA